ncbi:MAG TPA: pyrroline-5-carboxylate reductase [Candidatus Sumerlaeota bacterium]|nr:MAG: Pyrroline-5-carboxylate reductase [candidate division BRC1 bacterium ADurb.Bin183]HOE64019.1 pyrroline-5-carboxylate reductase [Candidatus Sumerlaeota bacterium]HRR30446.1 pyrroline-5-carboxylate reductase [Candidatus Sumerlaeia bacterium]HON51088.1 pyrroline-5-carboxylate reductase [Candidatus Sumerlaeota bacterium]HOR65033.1 pyrroline-5-carboxylate reductase [Candidatus Sumerlaeota bacterium]
MLRIGFIGTGNVASAILGGIVPAGLAKAQNIWGFDKDPNRLNAAREIAPFNSCRSNKEVLEKSDVVILAVKPKDVPSVLEELKGHATPKHLFISVCAGIKTSYIEEMLGDKVRVIRVMPNTPALIKCGASALAKGAYASEEDLGLALTFFNVIGVAVEVDEKDLDAVTGLSGSGPAYIFYMTECLVKAGVEVGLSPEVAEKLTKQMVLGAARMMVERKEPLKTLREMVTTPGGTTAAGFSVMHAANFEQLMIDTVRKATERSRELGEILTNETN